MCSEAAATVAAAKAAEWQRASSFDSVEIYHTVKMQMSCKFTVPALRVHFTLGGVDSPPTPFPPTLIAYI